MKTELTYKETTELIDIGAPRECANGKRYLEGVIGYYSTFTLADLLTILPNKISYNHDNCFLMIVRDVYGNYTVGYSFETFDGPTFCVNCEFSGDLIDALYQLTYWYYGVHLKNEK